MTLSKNVFLALACLFFYHFGIAAALPADPTEVSAFSSAFPSAFNSGAPSIPTAFTAAASSTGSPARNPNSDHKHGGPDFAPGAHNQTHNSFPAGNERNGTANSTDNCPDMPGNHTRHGVEVGHDHHHNRTDADSQLSGTPTGSFITLITPPPDSTAITVAKGAKFVQTTYYSCVTIGSYSHCGWHKPILDASVDSAGSKNGGKAWLAGILAMAAMLM